ncbi:MAG: M20/M25/M40 family metallo-hydrolase [Deltaproteobacteria bacterium]|nr:M20/M25/M40 family metallo-hydrolase [Deltaproteobacteria bacterium]
MAAVNLERLKALFLELVRIDSLSRKEHDVAVRIQREVESAGAVCRYDNAGEKVRGNTGNLIARIPGNVAGIPPFLLAAHMDTVSPGEGVKPIVEGDIVRTDGSTVLGGDDKSGCAVICEVLNRLHEGGIPHGPIDAVFTICEEIGLQGARNLDLALIAAKEGLVYDSDAPGHLVVRAPSAVSIRFTVKGLEAHAGVAPERGLSAIKIASEAIAAMRLGRIDHETTANLGVIEGGRAGNIIPAELVVRGEARSRNAAKLQGQIDHMIACFTEAVGRASVVLDGKRIAASFEHSVHRSYDGMDIPDDAPLVKKVIEAARRIGRVIEPEGTGGGCDANILNQRGIVAANVGTGMREIHTTREWLDIKDMAAAAELTLEVLQVHAGR